MQKDIRAQLRRAYLAYDRLMEKQGFAIVLVVCVLVIAFSALYTFHFREEWAEAPLEEPAAYSAAADQAQTLLEAQELVRSKPQPSLSLPTAKPDIFQQPVHGFLDRDFSMTEPQLFAAAHYWRVHPGIDLQADYGAVVSACADGTVTQVSEDAELGLTVRIRHANGYESVYAGLSDASYVRAGDPVRAGTTIGHVGNGVLAEGDQLPHLHFEVWKGDTAVDPVEMFLGL
ncbi:MAG: M23 family metallopeptidase [bacterium]|nr:M23 family metallopeptidase [bacterium]